MLNQEQLDNLPRLSPRALKRLIDKSDFDVLPKTSYKDKQRIDDLNEPLAEPAPVTDTLVFG